MEFTKPFGFYKFANKSTDQKILYLKSLFKWIKALIQGLKTI